MPVRYSLLPCLKGLLNRSSGLRATVLFDDDFDQADFVSVYVHYHLRGVALEAPDAIVPQRQIVGCVI